MLLKLMGVYTTGVKCYFMMFDVTTKNCYAASSMSPTVKVNPTERQS